MMKFLAALDRQDRRLLMITAILVICTTVLLVLVHPEEQPDSYIPSTYSTASHGAKAAYLLLARLGYRVERSEGPLAAVTDTADPHTVLILAEPTRAPTQQEIDAVKRLLKQGGRVLATGSLSAAALPDENLDIHSSSHIVAGICEAEPVAFSALTAGGKVVMHEIRGVWKLDRPAQRITYICGGEGVAVTYAVGPGTVVWWASATPLENEFIRNHSSLDLLLNSLQLKPGDRIIWDESLHSAPAAAWDPLHDRIILALLGQLLFAAILLVLARGRRSGPLRPLPAPTRSSSMEFVRALGGLYRASGANDVPVAIADERFRTQLAQRYGVAGARTADADTLAATLSERFGIIAPSLRDDLEASAGAGRLTDLSPRQALTLVQVLGRYHEIVARQTESRYATDLHPETDRGNLGTKYGPQHKHDSSQPESNVRRSA